MRWLPAAAVVFLLFTPTPVRADATAPLAVRPLDLPIAIVPDIQPSSFDLLDWRAEQREQVRPVVAEIEPHSHFGIKRHIGVATGYDNGVLHGSVGLYLTVVEWGRWNYGIPSPAIGFGHYQVYDPLRKQVYGKDESTLFISLASVHYRMGKIPSLGMNWYINLEQIFDLRQNMAGSQVGVTFSSR